MLERMDNEELILQVSKAMANYLNRELCREESKGVYLYCLSDPAWSGTTEFFCLFEEADFVSWTVRADRPDWVWLNWQTGSLVIDLDDVIYLDRSIRPSGSVGPYDSIGPSEPNLLFNSIGYVWPGSIALFIS